MNIRPEPAKLDTLYQDFRERTPSVRWPAAISCSYSIVYVIPLVN